MNPEKFEIMRELMEEQIPFNRLLGLRLTEAADGRASMEFDFRKELVGNFKMNILHGGVISAVLDVIGAVAVIASSTDEQSMQGMGTVDLRIDFLRPGAGKRFKATGNVMRPGRVLASTRMELHNEENQLIAIGTAIYRVSTKDKYILMNI